jgi:hypothetical protein
MLKLDVTRAALAKLIAKMDEPSFARFLYCQHMSATFIAVHQLEHMIISAMLMCDSVQVGKLLREDVATWQKMLRKKDDLQRSTLGNLIGILERHSIDPVDIAYLRWVKDKRDYFIHRLFHGGGWPGDIDVESSRFMTRRLVAIEIWLSRAEKRIWHIFRRAGLVLIDDLGSSGLLITNVDLALSFGADLPGENNLLP